MLAIYLNKMPSTVNVDEATVNMNTEAAAEEIIEPINESDPN
ncbi:hypothetical protein [Hymenobacter sp. APR13]|nr:hypothetical protein [Hymenobacter sp. APR13]